MPSADSTDRGPVQPIKRGWLRRASGALVRRCVAIAETATRQGVALVYPPHCIACEAATAEAFSLCVSCWNDTPFIARPYCDRLGTPFAVDYGEGLISPAAMADPPRFDRARAVALHKGTAKSLVSRLKYGERLDLAGPMARMMASAGREILGDCDLILPVPMHRARLWRRRFNQAALLANALGRETGLPVLVEGLVRRRHTPPQVGLTRAERQKNLTGAFALGPPGEMAIAGRRVVVIDDVRTTSSTLNACAHILRKAGAARIDALTFSVVTDGED